MALNVELLQESFARVKPSAAEFANSFYDNLSGEALLERLGSWSPVVRERAAMALGRRQEVSVPPLV
ncbi:MAG: hypothetical protein MUC60_18905, partial [Oscillatoria sp. Prado101]|nr:hypothetical protein [Oscillatoria sp. Prado101]